MCTAGLNSNENAPAHLIRGRTILLCTMLALKNASSRRECYSSRSNSAPPRTRNYFLGALIRVATVVTARLVELLNVDSPFKLLRCQRTIGALFQQRISTLA